MKANRLCVLLGALVRGAARRPILRDRSGAVWVYVAVTGAVMLGMVGLTLDLGRFATLNTQAQDAADAAALAAASQLNGQAGAITRATNAAQAATGLVTNQQAISSTGGNVTIDSLTFYSALNSATAGPTATDGSIGTVTTDDTKARFAQVTTHPSPHDNWFIPAIGASASATTAATAVAGNTVLACKISPLVVCNPEESASNLGADFTLSTWKGRQVLLKAAQAGAQWQPGDFGLLDTANGQQSTQAIAQELAAPGANICVQNVANTKPGQSQGMREALNTQFDMWQNPFFGSTNAKNNSTWAPAVDVTKGMSVDAQCNTWTPLPANEALPVPRDTCFNSGTCNNGNRFGDGTWDCATFWSINHGTNHPVKAAPTGCTSTANGNTGGLSRWAMFQFEMCPSSPGTWPCPGSTDIQNNTSTGGENENPTCANVPPSPLGADRRTIYFAVVDCLQNSFNGHATGVPVTAFVKGFLTEPVANPPSPVIYLEIVDKAKLGDGILHDIVQLYR